MIILVCMLAAIAILIALKQYNKPHTDIRNSKPEMVMTPPDLIKEFVRDENTATKLYTEKIIQINGIVNDINTSDEKIIVTFKDGESESSVICHMQAEEKSKTLKLQKGQKISVKGMCSGFLLDVMMVRCVLINEKNE